MERTEMNLIDNFLDIVEDLQKLINDHSYIHSRSFGKKRLFFIFNKVNYAVLIRMGEELEKKVKKIRDDLMDLLSIGTEFDDKAAMFYLGYVAPLTTSVHMLNEINKMNNEERTNTEEYKIMVTTYERSQNIRVNMDKEFHSVTQHLAKAVKRSEFYG